MHVIAGSDACTRIVTESDAPRQRLTPVYRRAALRPGRAGRSAVRSSGGAARASGPGRRGLSTGRSAGRAPAVRRRERGGGRPACAVHGLRRVRRGTGRGGRGARVPSRTRVRARTPARAGFRRMRCPRGRVAQAAGRGAALDSPGVRRSREVQASRAAGGDRSWPGPLRPCSAVSSDRPPTRSFRLVDVPRRIESGPISNSGCPHRLGPCAFTSRSTR